MLYFISAVLNALPESSVVPLSLVLVASAVLVASWCLVKFLKLPLSNRHIALMAGSQLWFPLLIVGYMMYAGTRGPNSGVAVLWVQRMIGVVFQEYYEIVSSVFGDSLFVDGVTWVMVLLPVQWVSAFLVLRKNIPQNFKPTFSLSIFTTILSVVLNALSTALAVGVFVGIFTVSQLCLDVVRDGFHTFNGHLKDVCSDQKKSAECPRDITQLEAFRPDAFALLQRCSQVKYHFDSANDKYSWSVKMGNEYFSSDMWE